MDEKKYHRVIEYNLTQEELKAYKIALLWEQLTAKHFPKAKGVQKLAKGNPTKCALFKQCWKLLRETRGLLRQEEYKQYIEANLQGIKVFGGHLSPNILCGDKAWIRWKIWKRLFDQKLAESKGTYVPTETADPKIVKMLDKTKRFLFEKCEGEPTLEKFQKFLDDQSLKMWVLSGKLSHYWIVQSPMLAKVVPLKFLEKDLDFDAKLYQEKINDAVRGYFKKEFGYEFEDNTS